MSEGCSKSLALESLENRVVPASAFLSGNVLLVYAHGGESSIDVTNQSGQVRVSGVSGSWAASQIAQIYMIGSQGNDHMSVSSDLGAATTMYGYNGDDVLSGGSGNDRIYGGSGNDVLSGNGGNDYLHGADGNDTYLGGAGWDWCYDRWGVSTLLEIEAIQ
jgi:Ca2+-binding RTX toxin-like protein